MEKIEINNLYQQKIPNILIKKTAENAILFLKSNDIVDKHVNFQLSFALVGGAEISQLNDQYRNKKEQTDVLSFCYEKDDKKIIGEIILCPEVIEENAKNDKIEMEIELKKNIIHGILHIIGFEHGKKMFSLQEKILTDK